jgi:hypothetical protein
MHISHYLLMTCIALSPLAGADALNDQAKQLAQSPAPNVFRSVLNERPRMLTVQLDSHHAIAYDTWHCQLAMAWKVESGPLVNLDATVYTGNHGPQPNTLGSMVFENTDNEFSSALGKIVYLGHAFRKGKTVLRYGIKNDDHKLIATIEEIPQWSGNTLKRSFRVVPASMGAKITLTPAKVVQWKKGKAPFSSSSLAAPITINISL